MFENLIKYNAMHFIVKVFFSDDNEFRIVCITHKKDRAMEIARKYATFNVAEIVEVYRETLVERVKLDI